MKELEISLSIKVKSENGILSISDDHGKLVSFAPEQIVQKKVSMVTLGELSGLPKLMISKAFGFATRKSYYDIRQNVLTGMPADLLPQRTGPKHAYKRTKEAETLVVKLRLEKGYNMYEITDTLKDLGFDLSPSLVGEILADYGLSKKKLFK